MESRKLGYKITKCHNKYKSSRKCVIINHKINKIIKHQLDYPVILCNVGCVRYTRSAKEFCYSPGCGSNLQRRSFAWECLIFFQTKFLHQSFISNISELVCTFVRIRSCFSHFRNAYLLETSYATRYSDSFYVRCIFYGFAGADDVAPNKNIL